MSQTTKILFNSPALHSLKRDQLVKLCKIHSIKANGKNVDLIQRLRQHALTLPKDDPLSIAARSETDSIDLKPLSTSSDTSQDESDLSRPQMTRPSEQWEIVMESIQEVEETASSQGTLSSLRTIGTTYSSGEFGTANSKASTVSSSIKALATSLGLKRTYKSGGSTSSKASAATQQELDELTQNSIPYSAVQPATPPLNDNFTFDPTTAPHTRMSFAANGDPLPGCSLRPGEPAPTDARLSLGLGLTAPAASVEQQPTTTIRLVSNQPRATTPSSSQPIAFQTPKLKPFATTFDLVMTPSVNAKANNQDGGAAFWAPDVQFQSLYPTLTADDLPPALPPSPIKSSADKDTNAAGSTNTNTLAVPAEATTRAKSPSPDPFIFGSPLPQHSVSNTQFRTAASSVLEEMNKRLLSSGVEGLGTDIVNKLQPGAHTQEEIERMQREVKPLPMGRLSGAGGRGELTQKFDDAHRAEFAKMEGIDGLVKRKGAEKAAPALEGHQPQHVVGKKRKSSALGDAPRRPTTGPGAMPVGGRTSGTTRVISNGRRAKALPGAFGEDEDEEEILEENGEEVDRGGKRVRMDPDVLADGDANTTAAKGNAKEKVEDAMDVDNEDHEAGLGEGEEEKESQSQRDREREVIKRKLDISRAKRRSSAGGAVAAASAARRSSRVSGVRGPATPKPKPRFGFLTSAKNLVASVWNRGKAAQPAAKPTTSTPTYNKGSEMADTKSSLLKKKGATPSFAPTKSSVASGTPMGAGSTSSRLSVSQEQNTAKSVMARSRSPIPPSFGTATSRVSSTRMSSVGGSKVTRTSATSSGSNGVSSIGTRLSAASNTGSGEVGSLGAKTHLHSHSHTSSITSRLLAPTASSLAKTRNTAAASSVPLSPTMAGPALGHKKKPSLLGAITNSPKLQGIPRRGAVLSPRTSSRSGSALPLWSPKSQENRNRNVTPGKIFSKPLVAPGTSGIPVLSSQKKPEEGSEDVSMADVSAENGEKPPAIAAVTPGTVTRQRTITRKPRISRSKVIARLASQRAAASSSSRTVSSSSAGAGSSSASKLLALPATPASRPSAAVAGTHASARMHGKRTRSSLGARPGRASFAGPGVLGSGSALGSGGGARGDRERSVLASAKKRVRQSEYARRRSRVSGSVSGFDD
ncbi:hypothetical protein P691DRAFT_805696 [Macrolepiota fuliginosa MF-IS2]|uniref:SAP domain-containing protein n=1 Tax=Macrolepiota fuliginosa MF-IS2 TaxID=1400762 RepID=A0A9P5X5Y0_9AGAR|nr:hypothetical protein P691DRAFT_805696 [Macrolepiota fuliginosa MF-IS2]